jgi:signal transduction histidine kinase
MFFARMAELRATTPVRLTLGFLSLFTLGSLLVFGYLNHQLSAALREQVDAMLRDQRSVFVLQQQEHGISGVYSLIRNELKDKGDDERAYRVLDRGGRVLLEAGSVALPELTLQPRIQELQLSAGGSVRVLGFSLPGEATVFVGIGMQQTARLKAGLWRAFVESEVLIILLGLVVGFWLARRFRGQVEAFNQLTLKIVNAGDLSSRMPVKGNDEFAALAANMNAMLGRIEKLVQGVRQVGDNIAHDIRTPLTRLRADVELALHDGNPETCRATLERVLEEVEGMHTIVNSLLALGQAEAGGMRLKAKVVDLSALLAELGELYGPSAEDNGLELESRVAADLLVHGDKQLLAQAFSNLLDNAIKYVPAGGKVLLTAVRRGKQVEIVVEDNGPGIPAEMREKIFERFTRIDPSRTLAGSGLGLALVKAFVELNQGRIGIGESALGGAAFKITLPAFSA